MDTTMNYSTPLVSVILPVYNGGQYLKLAIDSILEQTYQHFELIIINDGSTDETDTVIKSYHDKRIRYFSRENKGLIQTLNEGLYYATGEFIARHDADDLSVPERFDQQVNFLTNHTDVVLVGSFASVINDRGIVIDEMQRPVTSEQLFAYLPFFSPFVHGSVMFRQTTITTYKIAYRNEFIHAEDYFFWHELMQQGKAYNLPTALYWYRSHAENVTHHHLETQLSTAEKIRELIQQHYQNNTALFCRWNFQSFIRDKHHFSKTTLSHYQSVWLEFLYLLAQNNAWTKLREELLFARRFMIIPNKLKRLIFFQTIFSKPAKITHGQRPRIVVINNEESRTGAPTLLFEIARSLKKNYDIIMISLRKGSLSTAFNDNFVIIYPQKNESAKSILTALQPDLVYANTVGAHAFAVAASKLQIKTIYHIHELSSIFHCHIPKTQHKYFHNTANVFVSVSPTGVDFLHGIVGIPASKIQLIPGFISRESILEKSKAISLPTIRNEIQANPNEILVIAIGYVHYIKGTDILLDCLDYLSQDKTVSLKIIWIGQMDKKWLSELPAYNSLNSQFIFLGEKENPYPYLAAADMFVLPSRQDTFPLVCLEAMALNKPIISFKQDIGIASIIEGTCGLVVETRTSAALAQAILELAKDKQLQQRFAKNGQLLQKNNYDASVILPKINQLVHEQLCQ